MNIELLIQIGSRVVPIVRDVAPHLQALKEFFEARGIEADRAVLNQIVLEAAEGQAISQAEVDKGSDPPAPDQP